MSALCSTLTSDVSRSALTGSLALRLAHEVRLDLPRLLLSVRLEDVVDHSCVNAFRVDQQAVHIEQDGLDVSDWLLCLRHFDVYADRMACLWKETARMW